MRPQGTSDTEFEFLGMTAIVASRPMLELLELAQKVGRSKATVLITGESGSGKEMIARALHYYSVRSHRPWVDLSCAALPEHLLESELFGYEKGAFSGADAAKPGLFELANQGTIFLDEVGELDPRMQVKLLRVLDGTPYYRLGGTRKVAVDVRVVTATNRDLEEAVHEGRFRSDLFHRLNQVTLHVPPLRERVEDIEPLARHFLAQHDGQMELTPRAIMALTAHSWPGNIRELRNIIIQSAVMVRGLEIDAHDLKLARTNGWHKPVTDIHEVKVNGHAAGTNLDEMEKRMILEALASTGGHQQKAAEQLGISRRTLSRKLKQYHTAEARAAS